MSDSSFAEIRAGNVYEIGSSNAYVTAKGNSAGSANLQLEAYSNYCSFSASQIVTVPPTVAITMAFTRSKSGGDNLLFSNSGYDCSEGLGPHNCSYSWLWNVEGKGVVSDEGTLWTVKQSVVSGLAKGYLKLPNGTLQSFTNNISPTPDGPNAPEALQQTSGSNTIYWIDGPGSLQHTANPVYPINSITQVVNYSTEFCSTTVAGDCQSINWYAKLVVDPGGVLDLANSEAALGSASLNF